MPALVIVLCAIGYGSVLWVLAYQVGYRRGKRAGMVGTMQTVSRKLPIHPGHRFEQTRGLSDRDT